jgi:pimeloyl-ACP methyl ester carboxylesterase
MGHTAWTLQSRYLAHHGRGVLAVDLPGHCRSDGPALTSVAAQADWLAALVGHSMGALASLECVARHPALTARGAGAAGAASLTAMSGTTNRTVRACH